MTREEILEQLPEGDLFLLLSDCCDRNHELAKLETPHSDGGKSLFKCYGGILKIDRRFIHRLTDEELMSLRTWDQLTIIEQQKIEEQS